MKKTRIISVILFLLIIIAMFGGCFNPVDNASTKTNVSQKEDGTILIENNQEEKTEEMHIIDCSDFKDGYAYLLLETKGKKEYVAITDKNGNITYLEDKETRGGYYDSWNGYFYFGKHDDTYRNVSCVDYTGKEIYNYTFPINDEFLSYKCSWGDDGTLFLSRKCAGFDYTGIQVAWIDQSGNYTLDWTFVPLGKEQLNCNKFSYCENGFVFLNREDLNGEMLDSAIYDMNTANLYILEGIREFEFSEMMGGFMVVPGYYNTWIVSETGEIVNDLGRDNSDRFVDVYDNQSSDNLVFNFNDYGLYDSSTRNKVAEVEIPEISKGGYLRCSSFKNGYAYLVMTGSEGRRYFTLINNRGEKQFEPILIPDSTPGVIWDGTYLVTSSNEGKRFAVYNKSGTLEIETDFMISDNRSNYSVTNTISEGIIKIVIKGKKYNEKYYCYMKVDGSFLFENGIVEVKM